MNRKLPLVILGGGGHARVLADTLLQLGRPLLGYTAPADGGELAPGVAWLGDDGWLEGQPPAGLALVNGLGTTGRGNPRQALFSHWTARAYRFATVIHPQAILPGQPPRLGQGVQLLAGAVLGPGVTLGNDCLVNTRAVVEHDCRLGDHVHLATGAILCGGCAVGDGVHVGAGAVVIQGIQIGYGAIIAAGAVVTENVEPLTLIAGVPGKVKRTPDDSRVEKDRPG